MRDPFFFNDWSSLADKAAAAVIAYFGLILILRISGKRTLSKMNVFDFIVTVAYGSTLATVLLSKDVTMMEALMTFGMLTLLQYLITFTSVRWDAFERVIKFQPEVVYYRGEFCRQAMRSTRVSEREIRAAARESGQATLDKVAAVVLETDGTLTVIKQAESEEIGTLEGVREPE